MQPHATKRIYTPQSLEFWFDKLRDEWSKYFNESQLGRGRRLYREGHVRELELTTGEAIIHRRVDKHDEYALIEWVPGEGASERLHVRSSTTDLEEARALAVAGLHEIEELVADEIPALVDEAAAAAPAKSGGARADEALAMPGRAGYPGIKGAAGPSAGVQPLAAGLAPSLSVRRSQSARAAETTAAAAPVESRPDRGLLLVFKVKPEGLSFQAYWLEPGGARQAALGAAAHARGAPHVSSAERAKLIGLAAYARKAHLHYDQESGVYLMESLVEIPGFLKTTLPAWERLFAIELDARAEHLRHGTRLIDIEGQVLRGGAAAGGAAAASRALRDTVEGINLRWIFRVGEQLLSPAELRTVLKNEGKPVLLPNVGVVAITPEKLSAYRALRPPRPTAVAATGQGRELGLGDFAGAAVPGSDAGAGAANSEASASDGAASTESVGEATLPPYLVFSLFNEAGLKLTLSAEIEAWRQRVLAPPPAFMDLPELLRPYQRRGVEWLAHLGELGCHGLLADEMGLGKTLQIIALLARACARASASGNASQAELALQPVLIVCPASVVPVWQEEIARFAPELRTAVLKAGHDFASDRRADLVWIASYTQLRKHRAQLAAQRFDYAVLDEGQFIKNPDAKVSQTCWEIRAERRIVLTGTPLENRQLDLWSLFRFLLPGLLGTRASFEAALAADRLGTTERLRAQLAPFILRRTKREVAKELPQKVEMELLCPLSDVQKAEYVRTCSEGLERLGDDMATALREKSFGFLALLTRLRQTCCDPDLLPWRSSPLADSGKLMLLIDKLAELIESGHKVVIFSQFVKLLDRVKVALDTHYPLLPRFELTGATLDRQRPVQEFQTAVGAAAMLVSLKAAGTGITLHAADYVFLLDPWWNPAVEAQAVDRVHRIGQANTVFVYRMVTAGTIEERIQDLKAEKKELFDKLLGGSGSGIDLGAHFDSLRSLVELGASAHSGSESVLFGAHHNGSGAEAAASAEAAAVRDVPPRSPRAPALDLAALAAAMQADSLEAGVSASAASIAPASTATPRASGGQSELDFTS